MILAPKLERCPGFPAGPQGLQLPRECFTCARRFAAAVGYPMMEPPKEMPCPHRIPHEMQGN